MAKFAVHVRLRPIRFGFLVKPHDVKSLLEIFRVNTCLWGGTFNPIIPHLRSVPRWWDRHGHTLESARQIVNGYLDFFEPDFFVESVPGLSARLELDSNRVLPLSEMLRREDEPHTKGQRATASWRCTETIIARCFSSPSDMSTISSTSVQNTHHSQQQWPAWRAVSQVRMPLPISAKHSPTRSSQNLWLSTERCSLAARGESRCC